MFKVFLAVLLALVSGLGSVANAESTMLTPALHALPFSQLGIYTSQPGENERVFLLRIADVLQAFTGQTGHEACGVIAYQGQTFGVVLGTNHSQIGCLAGEAGVIEGMTPTGETIHSHPAGHIFKLTRTDRQLAWATHAAEPGARTFYGSPNGFSDTDYDSGPGFLVAGGRLLYQSHPHQQDVVGSL